MAMFSYRSFVAAVCMTVGCCSGSLFGTRMNVTFTPAMNATVDLRAGQTFLCSVADNEQLICETVKSVSKSLVTGNRAMAIAAGVAMFYVGARASLKFFKPTPPDVELRRSWWQRFLQHGIVSFVMAVPVTVSVGIAGAWGTPKVSAIASLCGSVWTTVCGLAQGGKDLVQRIRRKSPAEELDEIVGKIEEILGTVESLSPPEKIDKLERNKISVAVFESLLKRIGDASRNGTLSLRAETTLVDKVTQLYYTYEKLVGDRLKGLAPNNDQEMLAAVDNVVTANSEDITKSQGSSGIYINGV